MWQGVSFFEVVGDTFKSCKSTAEYRGHFTGRQTELWDSSRISR